MSIDSVTKRWMRDASDELAVKNGCRFDEERGLFVVDWIETYCKLYEGDWAGQPMKLLDWARDATMRLFGWVRHSEQWGREVRRFRQASIWVAKKNGKSPLLAAWGLYLLSGDGEPGQKVFLAAKDGKQAREIAGAHALEMVRQSPELNEECSINLNLMRITHEPSRSFMQPLSSSNARTQKSKEGLNGSVLIDEVHVVDRAFVDRISRAGISRSEPLQIEVSTAGDDPDGYGKSRFDRACKVRDGEIEDEKLFVAVYAAPQDLSETDLDADPLKYGKMANPAIGKTVDPAEYLHDYNQSKNGTIDEFAKFKMYRLNIWQQSSNPWLKKHDWTLCGDNFTEADLLGRECYGGLDLALRWDTTALVLIFPWGEDEDGHRRYRLWPYFWLPEETARKTRHLVPWFDWEKSGYIAITDDAVTDFPLIRRAVVEASKKFDLRGVAYDERFAQTLAQELAEDNGIEMEAFGQTPMNFLEPVGLFENLVKSQRITHPKNACMDWQAGHAVKHRKGMLDKPEDGSHKKIDGVTASLQALGFCVSKEGGVGYWSKEDGVLL